MATWKELTAEDRCDLCKFGCRFIHASVFERHQNDFRNNHQI